MKRLISVAVGLLLVATGAWAGISRDASWDEIQADKSLKVVFPAISVGNGMYVSYDKLFLDGNRLTSAGSRGFAGPAGTDREPEVVLSPNWKVKAILDYRRDVLSSVNPKDGGDRRSAPLAPGWTRETHPISVEARVYKRMDRASHESKDSGDIFLFKKAYSVPIIGSKG